MHLSNTITFPQDFQISPLQNIFHAQPRVSEEIFFSILFKSNIWWSSKQVLWCVSGFYFGWRPRLRRKPCRQSTIANTPGEEEKGLVEVAARAAAHTGHLMLLQTVQMLLSQGTAGTGGSVTPQGGTQPRLPTAGKVKFYWPSWKMLCSGIWFMLIPNLNNNNQFIISTAFLINL